MDTLLRLTSDRLRRLLRAVKVTTVNGRWARKQCPCHEGPCVQPPAAKLSLRTAHPVTRASINEKTIYSTTPNAARMNRPANTRGTSKLDDAIIIRLPMPRLEATVSEITVPTNASVAATFNEAKKYGMVRGRPTFHRISSFVARNVFITSCNSGSVAARPVATFTTMGKMHMIMAV